MSIKVIKAGALSLFQDKGRYGFQKLGVPVCGPMDANAHRLANLLVGNPDSMATLEITLLGPTLHFTRAACIAISGAHLGAQLNNEPLAINRPYIVQADDVIHFSKPVSGCRSYLAVHGGFALTPVLNSCSTYLKGKLGGHHGGALRAGDQIELNTSLDGCRDVLAAMQDSLWDIRIYLSASLGLNKKNVLRVIKGPQWPMFTVESVTDFLTEPFLISLQSDRMGYRINGPALKVTRAQQMLSEAVAFGAIQVPHGGDPIVIMADRQTMGGYPKIAYIISADLPSLAQSRPHEKIRFKLISLEQAQQLDLKREQAFEALAISLQPVKHILSRKQP
ncbi:biotin-dependent carboxyltransferase family protein [Alcaligenaceae bacterium CGII-47]|nr:biotin-dependent carboxyltransferase family protein [Alcaligenaceae bacterium CGII-47]